MVWHGMAWHSERNATVHVVTLRTVGFYAASRLSNELLLPLLRAQGERTEKIIHQVKNHPNISPSPNSMEFF